MQTNVARFRFRFVMRVTLFKRTANQIVKIGNFVEIKNSTLGPGTKAAHLGYIGDADVGSGVNFSCGAIVVNYDGYQKTRSQIGDGAFIGCNANLVSPVVVAPKGFVAAGIQPGEKVAFIAIPEIDTTSLRPTTVAVSCSCK